MENITVTNENPAPTKASFAAGDTIKLPERFAALNRVVLRDLNANPRSPTFYQYSKDQITQFIQNPAANQKALRDAAIYIYNVSSHFRRLIQYFAGLTDLAYVITPYGIDPQTAKPQTIRSQYRRTQNLLASMDIKNQFAKVLTVCLREDTFYGTMWVTNDNVTVQQLPSDYCNIAVIEGGVFNVSFDFSYFDSNSEYLELYPQEFKTKYAAYERDRTNLRWQELDSPNSFAIKCNTDIPNYSLPPFAGIFREVYDLEDYKALKLTKTELENYAMLVMYLGRTKDGEYDMDYDTAKSFWRNLSGVLPEEVGSILSPMKIEKIGFDKSNVGDTDEIADAEQSLFTAAGVSSLLFNNSKASSNALLLSIKADQAITFGIVKSIEGVINRFVRSYSYGKKFKVVFLDCSPFNRKELGDQYLKAIQYGIPVISAYVAIQGLPQGDMDAFAFLENSVLGLGDLFKPLASSATQSSSEDAGRPEASTEELSESGEISRENEDGDDN